MSNAEFPGFGMLVGRPQVRTVTTTSTTPPSPKKKKRKRSSRHYLNSSLITGKSFTRRSLSLDSWLPCDWSYLLWQGYILTCRQKIRSRWVHKAVKDNQAGSAWAINPHYNHIEMLDCIGGSSDPSTTRYRHDISWIRNRYPGCNYLLMKIDLRMMTDEETLTSDFRYVIKEFRVYTNDSRIPVDLPPNDPGSEQKRVLEL